MIGRLRTRICKQPIIALYFEFENELKFYNLEARFYTLLLYLSIPFDNGFYFILVSIYKKRGLTHQWNTIVIL